jgi:ankyrin repeat protein
MYLRRLPKQKSTPFEGTMEDQAEEVYLKEGVSFPVTLILSSEDKKANEAQFKLVSWEVAGAQQGDLVLEESTLKLGRNAFRYVPKSPGSHQVTIKVAIKGEEEHVRTFRYTLAVKKVTWEVTGTANEAGVLTINIQDTPVAFQEETWRIIKKQWSKGLIGALSEDVNTLQYGNNHLNIVLTGIALEEHPTLTLTIQGPDEEEKSIAIDLEKACLEQINAQETALSEKEADVEQYVQKTDAAYQLPRGTVNNARINHAKHKEIKTLLGRLTTFYTDYQESLKVFENNLTILDRIQVNENLPVFKKQITELEKSIARSKSAQVQIQRQCTTAHETLFKIFRAGCDGYKQEIETLLNDPSLDVNAKDEDNEPLLYAVALERDTTPCKLLIDRGARVNEKNSEGATALHAAIRAGDGNIEIARLLIEEGAKVNEKNSEGKSALVYAVLGRDVEAVRLLLEKEAEVNAKDNDGNTPLIQAAQHYKADIEIVRLLLDGGAKVNEENNSGDTALTRAKQRGYEDIVNLLLERVEKVKAGE